MKRELRTFHVMPLLVGYEAELAADAEQLLASGVATDIACMLTLVPESDPPVDKAAILGERFLAFLDRFKGDRARVGILAQATIGHGWPPDEPAPYQKIVTPDGAIVYQMCPLDAAFQHYISKTFRHLAALNPAFFMIDDDFRLLTGRNGCYCPLHLAAIGSRLGETFTRENLLARLRTDSEVARAYDALLLDSLMQVAGIIRESIDEVDPSIPGSFCACDGDIRHAGPIWRALAGKDQPRVIRINNARYLNPEMRSFPRRMYSGAGQIAALAADAGEDITVLAETDTCPHNRYSTGANLLHTHYTGSILEGCHGAKHWITRLHSYQPGSGAAYREVLSTHQGFYQTLFRAVQESEPSGYAAAVLPSTPFFNHAPDLCSSISSWGTWSDLMGVLGLPCNFARMPDLPAMMTGAEVELFSDDDLRQLLTKGLLLDGRAAEMLCQRGFSAEIGVVAKPWSGRRVSAEQWGPLFLAADACYSHLTPVTPTVTIHSTLLHRTSGVSEDFTELGAAVALFENSLGGRVATLAANLKGPPQLMSFGFYDENRKRELVELLGFVCAQPVEFYYPGDAEVYLKVRRFADGRYLLAFFNLGHDSLAAIPLKTAFAIAGVDTLSPEGSWEQVGFAEGHLDTPLLPGRPKVFRATVA